MSFGYSIGDGFALVQLAWKTVKGIRRACGEYGELAREASSLHSALRRLRRELSNPESLLNRADDERKKELDKLGHGCEQVLEVMNDVVTKYNLLPKKQRNVKRLWQKIKFGNGEILDLPDIRQKVATHTSAIIMRINLCSLSSQGRVEKELNAVSGEMEGVRAKVDWIAATMAAKNGNGSDWTSYTNDDKSFWRELRHELVNEGYDSSTLRKHKHLLKSYVEELAQRGAFDYETDEEDVEDSGEKSDSEDSDSNDSENHENRSKFCNAEEGADEGPAATVETKRHVKVVYVRADDSAAVKDKKNSDGGVRSGFLGSFFNPPRTTPVAEEL